MPVPQQWSRLLDGSAFVVNLAARPDRLAATRDELRQAGFRDIRRIEAVDGGDPDQLARAWAACGAPPFAAWDEAFAAVPGKQGCFLSHLRVWQEIVRQDLPFACVFEDDIVFHRHWARLAPTYFAFTPRDWDLLFLGSMMVAPGPGLVRRTPVMCTHAYAITREATARLRPLLLGAPEGVGSIDIALFRHQRREHADGIASPFTWYAWNGGTFPDTRATADVQWAARNSGLVFQDVAFGTDIGVARAGAAAARG